jgi:hypothetical protein
MPGWRHHRELLNRLPVRHETWTHRIRPQNPLPLNPRILKINQQTNMPSGGPQIIRTLRHMLRPQPVATLQFVRALGLSCHLWLDLLPAQGIFHEQ